MEKYGFVYIWFDRKHKRYYIGSHWGTEDDGYICSSTWMRNAYKYRKEDFKRRIVSKVTSSKADLLKEEYRWLSMIKEEELGKRYYNLRNSLNGHWFTEEDRVKTLSEKISQRTKEAMYRPEVREKYLEGLKKRDTRSSDPEVVEKKRQSMIKTMAEKFPVDQRFKYEREFGSEEYRQNMSESCKAAWASFSEEHKIARGKNISEGLKASKEARAKHMSSLIWWNNGVINTRKQEAPGPEWVKGRLKK